MTRGDLFPFLLELSRGSRRELDAIGETRAAAGRVLLSRGTPCGGAYLVLRGVLQVTYFSEDGRQATLYRVVPGETCVLALASTLERRPYPAWVQAGRAGATFLRVPDELFHRQMDTEVAFRRFVTRALADRILDLMGALERLATRTVVQRVAAYVAGNASRGELQITQAALAVEIGSAREVVFRALQTLTELGLVRTRRGRIQVVDGDALVALSDGRTDR